MHCWKEVGLLKEYIRKESIRVKRWNKILEANNIDSSSTLVLLRLRLPFILVLRRVSVRERCRIAACAIPADVLALVPLRVTRGRGCREICEFLFNCRRNHKGKREVA